MHTVINLKSFDQSFIPGLIFAMFDGLKPGEIFQIISEKDLENIKTQFIETNVNDLRWNSKKLSENTWEIRISKEEKKSHHQSSCCGICGNVG